MDTEATLEAVEETLQAVDTAVQVVKSNKKLVVVASLVSFAAGAGVSAFVSFKVSKKRLEDAYEERYQRELGEVREYYAKLHKKDEFETPEKAVEALLVEQAADAVLRYDKIDRSNERPVEVIVSNDPRPPVEVVVQNVFTEGLVTNDGWDIEVEEVIRDEARAKGLAYIIHQEEFLEAEPGYNQVTYTYFSGDDVLVDEQDRPIDQVEVVLGELALQRFGHGSKDKRIVYVRNEKLELDIEVALNEREYTDEVLGLKHSDSRPSIRRFRRGLGDDE